IPGGATPGWPWRRRALSRGANVYSRLLLRLPVHDSTAGFRAYRGTALRRIDVGSTSAGGYGFQIEDTYRMTRGGGRIVEVPVVFRDRAEGTSKMSSHIAIEAARLVARWAIRDRVLRRTPAWVLTPEGGA